MATVDVSQFLYGRKTCIGVRLQVSLWANNLTSVDVHQFLHGRITCDRGRPPVYIWTFNMTTVDVNQFLYGRKKMQPCTLASFSMDVQLDVRRRPSVSVWTNNM